jgi:hypothetical protein
VAYASRSSCFPTLDDTSYTDIRVEKPDRPQTVQRWRVKIKKGNESPTVETRARTRERNNKQRKRWHLTRALASHEGSPASARRMLAPQFRVTPGGSRAHRLAACAVSALAGGFFVGPEWRHGAIAGDTSVVPPQVNSCSFSRRRRWNWRRY